MIAYLDSSVLLRVILGQDDRLPEWAEIESGVASALVEVECLRTLDRLRLTAGVGESDLAVRREAVYELLEAIELVEPTRWVLHRAAMPLPTTLGTLDAIHLATAEQAGCTTFITNDTDFKGATSMKVVVLSELVRP